MMDKLKPCPFCGKIPNAEYIEDVMYVICSNDLCGMSCIASVTLKEWNARPIEDELEAQLKVAIGYEIMWKVRMGEGVYQPFESKEIE